MLKKIGCLVLALVMVLAMGSIAFADGEATLTGGEVGGFTTSDTPNLSNKKINIQKELTAYNVDETTINAPTITYTYAIAAGAADINVTDAASDHENGTAVTVKTKAGVHLDSVVMTGEGQETGVAKITWTPDETLTASTGGTANNKDLTIDFTNVVFGAAGVYRYVITETAPDYAASGVTETTADVNKHIRYLDVYVRPATTFTDGDQASDWDIYGYVCMLENEEITNEGDTASTGAVKTNGFVAGTNDGSPYLADQYYTYNVTVSKTVTNDAYAKATHSFPFTVLFTNETITQPVDISSKPTGTVSGFTDPTSAALSEGNTKGIVKIKDGSSVKYIGIPNGTQIEVYETNDMTGVTYQVTTVTDGVTPGTVDQAVTSSTTPAVAVTQAKREAHESTSTKIKPNADADDDTTHTVAIENNLQLISPTGITLRIAPYALILVAGIALLVISRRRKVDAEEIA